MIVVAAATALFLFNPMFPVITGLGFLSLPFFLILVAVGWPVPGDGVFSRVRKYGLVND